MKHEPGPGWELDVLVAEHVMGWPKAYDAEADAWYDITADEIPHYSTDIGAAWDVIKCLSGGAYSVTINSYGLYTGYVRIERAGKATVVATGQSITTPHAICLAALKALKAQEATS